ncbi:MAG: DUF4136 domain-containing protein [Massilibacteroides sp.]|nr:DUF4136 domain-containing protein [Massilibacteroides sp.]MDD3061519.1 DUF4136 domain-containing protein [Massilibacteroides sp.]MDD4114814.1 DUF4136 domain-containing protein [Massilibacteroides sp.]MDD4659191.1 DUF4136 domain-containing protein [Massilibacteroides sp.]
MKKCIIVTALLIICMTGFAQSGGNLICRLGFSFEISKNANWGIGLPIVTEVYPYSSAELAGLKQFDIIKKIDGTDLKEIASEEINQLLNPADKQEVVLQISNLTKTDHTLLIGKECKRRNAISEDQLVTAFSMLSLESTSERKFVCPFKTTVTPNPVNFQQFRTFGFAPIDENNKELENAINQAIKDELTGKGLTYDNYGPDILINTYYYFDKNPNYKGKSMVVIEKEQNFRYDFSRNEMIKVPFISTSAAESEAEYILQFGFKMVDNIFLPGRVIWECEANEFLESPFQIEDYARIHVPLMCMQYPYVRYTRNVQYKVNKKNYNYTGLNFDVNRLEMVAKVDPNSPAAVAGIRTNDIIEKIEGFSLDITAEDATAAYKTFITSTMKFRDSETRFTDANGFTRCMYWDPFKYTQVADAIKKTKEIAPFSYLFYFAPYINTSGTNACSFNLRRGKTKFEAIIRPDIRSELSVTIE